MFEPEPQPARLEEIDAALADADRSVSEAMHGVVMTLPELTELYARLQRFPEQTCFLTPAEVQLLLRPVGVLVMCLNRCRQADLREQLAAIADDERD